MPSLCRIQGLKARVVSPFSIQKTIHRGGGQAKRSISITTFSSRSPTLSVLSYNNNCNSNSSPVDSNLLSWSRRTDPRRVLQCQQWRGKNKRAKMANRLNKLDEIAHRPEHEHAVERREKHKKKDAIRKGKLPAEEQQESNQENDEEHDEDDDDDEEDEEGVLPDPDKVQARMQKVLNNFEQVLKKIRGAEPTPEMFEDVMVEAYGALTPLKSVAQVVIASPTLAHATCFDPSMSKDVSKAIQQKLELNPSVEDDTIKIPLPRVSMETRLALTKGLKKRTEHFKTKVRKIRQATLDIVKQGQAGKLEHVSKDEAFRVRQLIEKTADEITHKLGEVAQAKHDAIMKV